MQVIIRDLFDVGMRPITIVPIGDVHIGAAACDEARLKNVVARIASEPDTYWLGMGDYVDAINRSDPRFDPGALAPWIGMDALGDLAKAEIDHALDILKPIAGKCLALVNGNHEAALTKHYEREVYGALVTGIREAGGFSVDHKLALGYSGWLRLRCYNYAKGERTREREKSSVIDFNLHHGFTGGRLAGGKALNMQRWVWSHNADVCLMGHSHNSMAQVEAVESIDRGGNVVVHKRIGAFTGTFLRTSVEGHSTYSEVKGYMPLPIGGISITLTPFRENPSDRIHITTSM